MLHKAWNSKGEVPYCFPRSSIKFQGHTGQNITDFDPNWAFPDYRPVAAFKSLRFALFLSRVPLTKEWLKISNIFWIVLVVISFLVQVASLALEPWCLQFQSSNPEGYGFKELVPTSNKAQQNRNHVHTVQCHDNTVSFLKNPHQRHSMSGLNGWAMGCFCELNPDFNSIPVSAVVYAIPFDIGPRYAIGLYILGCIVCIVSGLPIHRVHMRSWCLKSPATQQFV